MAPGVASVSTADFFTPVVDDAFDWGRIVAANALSDVYAMGGTPVVAVNLLGWPRDVLPAELAAEVLRGGLEVAQAAGEAEEPEQDRPGAGKAQGREPEGRRGVEAELHRRPAQAPEQHHQAEPDQQIEEGEEDVLGLDVAGPAALGAAAAMFAIATIRQGWWPLAILALPCAIAWPIVAVTGAPGHLAELGSTATTVFFLALPITVGWALYRSRKIA